MDILLDDAVGEAKVYNLEDPVLAGPEHIGRLQVSMYNALDKVLTLQVCTKMWVSPGHEDCTKQQEGPERTEGRPRVRDLAARSCR